MPSGYAPTASLCQLGKWWQHGQTSGIESRPEDAAARSAALRTWLAAEAAARGAESVLLVSHGGMLKQTFATTPFANAEFRLFDLHPSGEARACPIVPHPLTSG